MRLVSTKSITPLPNAPLLTRKEAAASLNIAIRSLDHLITAKEIKVVKVTGKLIRIRPSSLEDFLSAREGGK